jgi:hypothetical protein
MVQKLEVFQSLWAMEQRRPGVAERPMEQNFEMAARAGYHGLCVDPGVEEIAKTRTLKPLYESFNLKCMMNVFPQTLEEMPPLLDLAIEMNACLVNVIGGVMPLTVDKGIDVINQWMSDARTAGVTMLFETHRDCTLNDLYYTLQLMDAVPDMRLCADLSHYVIDREMRIPLSERDAGFMRRILERSDCFQGRVANREQVQVQIDFPQHQEWVRQFQDWWLDGMTMWRERNSAPEDDGAILYFLCELGPPPYAMTDSTGGELSDRWAEALTIRRWAEEIWNAAGSSQ